MAKTKKLVKEEASKNDVVADILYDSREQKPWLFDGVLPSGLEVKTTKATFSAGDYSLKHFNTSGDSHSLVIERKNSVEEFLGNIGKNWERFSKELNKLAEFDCAQIVIEDDLSKAFAKHKSTRYRYFNLPPAFIIKRIAEINAYYGVSVHFLSNRSLAQSYVANIFKYWLLTYGS